MARGPGEPPRGRPAELPEWFRPPDAVLPVVVQQPQTLVRTKEVVVALREIAAYPTGFTLTFAAFHRSAADARLLRRTVEYESLGDALVSGGLRCEVGFSD